MMLGGVGGAVWLVGWVPVIARGAERLVTIRVTHSKLVEMPAVLAWAKSLEEEVHRDSIGIFGERRQTDGVTVGVDQRHIERRRRCRHRRRLLSGSHWCGLLSGGHRRRGPRGRHGRAVFRRRHGGAVLGSRIERSR